MKYFTQIGVSTYLFVHQIKESSIIVSSSKDLNHKEEAALEFDMENGDQVWYFKWHRQNKIYIRDLQKYLK
jgi:hypothetical protein